MRPITLPRPRLLPALVAAALLAPAIPAPAVAAPPARDVPSRVLVGGAPGDVRSMAAVPGVAAAHTGPRTGVTVVELQPGASAAAVAAALADRPGVRWAEPDQQVHLDGLTSLVDDEHAGALWGLDNVGQVIGNVTGTPGVDVDVEEAWATTRGDRDVLVAVVDTGIDVEHPDLAGTIWHNPGEVAGNGVDDDRNGFVDDVTGWDFHHGDATVYDDPAEDDHGTHVAGTIAAVADNGRGVAGVAPGVRILPLKFLGPGGSGWTSDAVAALEYAAAAGADVANLSWGGGDWSRALSEAIAAIDAVVVAAAGNAGLDLDTTPVYPASYGHAHLVSVAAIDAAGALAGFSNHGDATVDLGAPGVGILSTLPGGSYGWKSGTSMAAPHVSGVAALARSVAPEASPTEIADALAATVHPLTSLAHTTRSGGLVDAGAVVAHLAPPEPAPVEPSPTGDTTDDAPVDDEPDPTTDTTPAKAPAPAPAPVVDVVRLAGTDRYATGVAISRAAFPDPVHEVLVATGASFADALSGAAAAGERRAPVLLVPSSGVPDVVRTELRRLAPDRVRVLGGAAVVPDAVVDELRAVTGASVRRLAGPDRYATSAAVSAHAFAPGVPVAYLATGRSFPDALAAGAAAGRLGGPVLLTDPGTLPGAVRDELARLRPARVVVLGGTGVVSEDVRRAAGAAADAPTQRIGGPTRYETAAAVVADAFGPDTGTVMVATGESFPDALGGGAAAAVLGAAVLLVPPGGALPDAVAAQLSRLSPAQVVVLGGTGALAGDAVDGVRAALG